MNIQSLMYRYLTKTAIVLSIACFTLVIIYTMLTRQTQYILFGIAMLAVPLFFTKRGSTAFNVTSTLVFSSALIYISTYYGAMIPRISGFNFGVLFALLVLPILFTQPKILTYCYVMTLFFFSGTSYGMAWGDKMNFVNIYHKGNGQLHLSLFNILLIIIVVSIIMHHKMHKNDVNSGTIHCNLYKYFWIFNSIYCVYILLGTGYGVPFWDTISLQSALHITNMTLFVFVLIQFFRSEKDIEQFTKIFLVSMLTRGLYGFVRFLFMGGDPANQYRRSEVLRADINITFFDWADGLIACVAVFYASLILLKGTDLLSDKWKKIHWMIIFVGLFNMMLSYRRTVWSGLILVLIWFAQFMTHKQRVIFGVFSTVIVLTLFVTLAAQRFGETAGEGFLQTLMPDIYGKETGEITASEGRFREISVAWRTIEKNLLFGVGPWGKYEEDKVEKFAGSVTVHSALILMTLKMGIVGLVSFIGIFLAYVAFWIKARQREWHSLSLRAFGEAGFAGFVFFIPSFFFAPMIHEYRIMSLLGFCLALPYVAYYWDRKKSETIVSGANSD